MLRSQKTTVYRLNHTPPDHLPLTVRSAGSYTLQGNDRKEPARTKWFSEIFWCESGAGDFHLPDHRFTLQPGEVCYLLPGEVHDLRPRQTPWKYHWITFDHKNSPTWLRSFGLLRRPYSSGPFPAELFQSIVNRIEEGTTTGDRHAAHLAHEFLLAATELRDGTRHQTPSNWVVECREIIDNDFTNPALNVNELAERLEIHRATLFRAFKKAYKMTPSQYLQNRRLHYAMDLLKRERIPMTEVSRLSGISDANYLTKQIKRISGLAPRDFRAHHVSSARPKTG